MRGGGLAQAGQGFPAIALSGLVWGTPAASEPDSNASEALVLEVLEEEEVGGVTARRRRWRCRRRWARQGFYGCADLGRCRAASTVFPASTFSAPHRASNSPMCGGRGR